MKRLLLLLTAGVFLAVFVLSSNSSWMDAWAQYRNADASPLPADKLRFGDLYGLSYLHRFKQKKNLNIEDVRPYYMQSRDPSNVHLYSICDSYLYNCLLNDSLLRHAEAYRYTRWGYEAKRFHLDPAKQNILLLETVERNARDILAKPEMAFEHLDMVADAAGESVRKITSGNWLRTHVFNRNIEQNLEYNLFEYPLFTPLKELKAWLNLSLFNRYSKDVLVSPTQDRLYYAPTADPTQKSGAFSRLPASEVDSLVTALNLMRRYYRAAGFAEVYLAIMPNPVTVLEPGLGAYNGLIPRIQRHPKLEMPVIDVYARLRHPNTSASFQRNDSHWSKDGFLTAISLIDSTLATRAR